jgi:hypothetical protein
MADPNGWVTSPPATIVKVHGVTSRENLNGSLGVVLQYSADRSRYVIHMLIAQDQVSLKTDNLTKATWSEQLVGQYQLLRHDRNFHRQLQTFYTTVQSSTGVKPEYLGVGALLILLASFYLLGFTKVMMIISFSLLVLVVIAPDLGQGYDAATIARNSPRRCRDMIRESIPVVGPRIADNQYLSSAFVAVVVIFFVRSLLPAATASNTAFPSFSSQARVLSFSGADDGSQLQKEQYYKLGFDDATALKPFGESLSAGVEDASSPNVAFEDDLDYSYPPDASRSPSTWTYVGIAMSSAYIYRTVLKLGTGAGGQFSVQTVQQNVSTMEPMSMFMLGLSIYRLVKSLGSFF